MDNPINAVTTKFVRTSTNKLRCPIFCVAVSTVYTLFFFLQKYSNTLPKATSVSYPWDNTCKYLSSASVFVFLCCAFMRIHLLQKVFLKNAEDHEFILKNVQVCRGMRFSLEFSCERFIVFLHFSGTFV